MNRTPSIPPRHDAVRRGFVISALVFLGLGLVIGAWVLWDRGGQSEDEIAEAEISAPRIAAPVEASSVPSLPFTDITEQAGIDFVHINGAQGDRLLPETVGSGAAFFDYDRDGDQDLLLVNSAHWPGQRPDGEAPARQALYRNDGTGRFTDVTEAAGLAIETYGMGAAIGDYDADGWPDLYLTSLHRNQLLRNRQGRFEDVTDTAGVGGAADEWSTSAGFVDVDRDGDLDLVVINYVQWTRVIDLEIDFRLTGLGRAYGAPVNFRGTINRLYLNDGEGGFTDATESSGLAVLEGGEPAGKGLALLPVDHDRDGLVDLLVANDTVRNFLYRNLGGGRFEEQGILGGIAFDRNGKATSAMGIDGAWFRGDDELGIAIGNFANEMMSLFVTTDGQGPFMDDAVIEGLGAASRVPLTFGLLFVDLDLDGREDLLLANGHLEQEIHRVQQGQTYAQAPQLFWNCGDDCRSRFLPAQNIGDLAHPLVGRGIASADIDADGDLDILITQSGRRPALLRNDQAAGNHWLRVRLEGAAGNTAAIGAELELDVAGRTLRRLQMPTRGYLSQLEPVVTFGLGTDPVLGELRILWPDGTRQTVTPPGIDQTLVVRQDAGQ